MKTLLKFCKKLPSFSFIFLFLFSSFSVFAEVEKREFAYIKSNEVNVRAGPSKRYPIRWVLKHRGEPMKVISIFENWSKVRDVDGEEGWVHDSMLNNVPHGVLMSKKNELLYTGPYNTSKPIARLESGIRFKVQKCTPSHWCLISIEGLNGWVPQKNIWGIPS
jgi:SH3-like domain-containing protein